MAVNIGNVATISYHKEKPVTIVTGLPVLPNTNLDLVADPIILCKLCLCEYALDKMFKIADCGCLFCTECMQQYISVLISEGIVMDISCPDSQCKGHGKVDISEIQTLVDEKTFRRFTRLKFQREVDLDPYRIFCPAPGCETVCEVYRSFPEESALSLKHFPVPVDCPTCGFQFCSLCKYSWHLGKSCDDNLPSHESRIPFANCDEKKIKRCPVCRVPIERDNGCAQMMCKRCKHVFCWYCLQSLDDDYLLRHYDKGPCKNRLGHSRASVIWHRTQVIGIFAGFGVLLIAASPFLLLAAPCIICCKVKSCGCCQQGDIDNDP